ncbi:hypothetical protein ABPG72_009207 [Tetrahymena utriculariae]
MKQIILIFVVLSFVLGTQNPLFLNETYTTSLIKIKKSIDIFYWNFESRSNPSEDSIAFWLAGGPGASSLISVLAGNGPFKLNKNQTLESNIYAWNNQANMVFVDQPVVQDQLSRKTRKSTYNVFLSVDPQNQYPSYGQFAFESGLISSYDYYVVAKPTLSDFSKLIAKKAPYKLFQPICMKGLQNIVGNDETPKFDVYDIMCTGSDCKSAFHGLSDYLNRADVYAALGVLGRTWQIESDTVYDALKYDYDQSFAQDIAFVLESGIKVLVQYGYQDFVCNYIGGLQWAENMNWNMQSDFQNSKFQDYLVDGKIEGKFKSAGKFSILIVDKSGHMVTIDQPALSLQMFNQFISNQYIRNKDQY